MEKNFILFVVLSAAILFGWNMTVEQPKQQAVKIAAEKELQTKARINASSTDSEVAITAAPVAAKAGMAQPVGTPLKSAKLITISNSVIKATFSNRGAKLIDWKLLAYEEKKGLTAAVELIANKGEAGGEDLGYGALHLPENDFATRSWTLLTPKPVKDGEAMKVVFSTPFKGPNFKLIFTKEFLFFPDRYDIEIRILITNPGKIALRVSDLALTWGPGIGSSVFSRDKTYGDKFLAGALAQTAEEKVFEKPDDTNETLTYENPTWVAIRNQYFVAALLPGEGFTKGEIRRVYRVPPGGNNKEKMMAIALRSGQITIKAGETAKLGARLLGSHQEYGFLKSFDNNLQGVVQFTPWKIFRILDPLAIAMLFILKWFFSVVGNWGVALILLTVTVKGVMFYPTMKGMVSMRKMSAKMARMKPRLETIKKMYKDEPTRLNQEMMKLYKEEGVNPLGGCLPLFVQMPIFFALYGTLLGSFELRGAEFVWFWTDLSSPEKYPVLAILMASSMFLQQRLTPQPSAQMNPEQAKMQKMMMNIMPLMLGGFAIFGGWPSGLLLYWSASNIFSIIQQQVVNRRYPVEETAAAVVAPKV